VNIYVDADAIANWEKGKYDLPAWIEENHPDDMLFFPPTVWQQLLYGQFAWEQPRAQKRARYVQTIGLPVSVFSRAHAERAAELSAQLKLQTIGFADFQIAACALVDGAHLISFNEAHFNRVPGLTVITP
jgi:predicted nucleic acid-binding protein